MESQEIVEKIKPLIEKYLGEGMSIDDITPDKNLMTDLKINSAYLIDIIISIEETFGIRVEDHEIPEINTVQQSIDIIQAKLAG